jgi:hypothetical protein
MDVFGVVASWSGRSSGAAGSDVRVRPDAEVRSFGRVGGQPGEEHGWAGGGDKRTTMRSSWVGARAGGVARSGLARAG